MNQTNPQEKRNNRIGVITSVVVHALFLLLALLLVTCYKSPGPPNRLSDIGVMVDMGSSDFGSNNFKSESTPNEITEVPDEVSESSQASQPVDATQAPVETEAEEVADVNDAPTETVTNAPSPVAVAPVTRTTPNPVQNQPQQPRPVTTTPVQNPKPAETGTPAPSNNGDDANKVGDKGNPQSVNESNIYKGQPGGGTNGEEGSDGSFKANVGGGWKVVGKLEEKRITHSGTIELAFEVDEYGEIGKVKVISSGFTSEEENILIQKIKNELLLEQTSNGRPPAVSQGTIVWKFKAK